MDQQKCWWKNSYEISLVKCALKLSEKWSPTHLSTPFKQGINNKTHPFLYNSLKPKLFLIQSYEVRKPAFWSTTFRVLSEFFTLLPQLKESPGINPMMWWRPSHINSGHIKWDPSSQILIDCFIMDKALP